MAIGFNRPHRETAGMKTAGEVITRLAGLPPFSDTGAWQRRSVALQTLPPPSA